MQHNSHKTSIYIHINYLKKKNAVTTQSSYFTTFFLFTMTDQSRLFRYALTDLHCAGLISMMSRQYTKVILNKSKLKVQELPCVSQLVSCSLLILLYSYVFFYVTPRLTHNMKIMILENTLYLEGLTCLIDYSSDQKSL